MNPITRALSPLALGLLGLTLGPLGQADEATFFSDYTPLPQLYAYHSSYPARARSYPGERGRGYTYPGARQPGYTYPGAKARNPVQQGHQNFNRNNHEVYENGHGNQTSTGNAHGGGGHH